MNKFHKNFNKNIWLKRMQLKLSLQNGNHSVKGPITQPYQNHYLEFVLKFSNPTVSYLAYCFNVSLMYEYVNELNSSAI